MKLALVKLANAIRVGTDDMITITSIGSGLGRFEVSLLADGITIEIKHLRMNTTTYTTIYNCIYYQKLPEVEKFVAKSKTEVTKLAASL